MYLKNYSVINTSHGNLVALGDIYDDEKGRFVDGAYIRTSSIVEQYEEDGKKYIKTRNSTYELRDDI